MAKKEFAFIRYPSDYVQTERNLIKLLATEKMPIGYQEAYRRCNVQDFSQPPLGAKTDPVEKLRQRYAEHDHTSIGYAAGRFYFKHWFPDGLQPSLLRPDEIQAVDTSPYISYDAGYNYGMRTPYMVNHYAKSSRKWFERMRIGGIVEYHCASFFMANYSDFYLPPDNESDYKSPCSHDFQLKTPFLRFYIDVKSIIEYEEAKSAVVSEPKKNHLYLFASIEQSNQVVMRGIMAADKVEKYATVRAGARRDYIVSEHSMRSIDTLLVFLNMAKCGENWFIFNEKIAELSTLRQIAA